MTALGSVEASLFMQELLRQVDKRIDDKIAQLEGAHRAYAWSIGDPNSDPPPGDAPPLAIELPCRPVDFMASCVTPPSEATTFDLLRSIDGGATYESILYAFATIASGDTAGAGATFMWEWPEDRALDVPNTEGALPLRFAPGDRIRMTIESGGASMLAASVQLRVQRIGEYTRGGR